MWRSLADNFTQPVAVFTSKGSVKGVLNISSKIKIYYVFLLKYLYYLGIDLTKLVLNAIML